MTFCGTLTVRLTGRQQVWEDSWLEEGEGEEEEGRKRRRRRRWEGKRRGGG